MDSEQFKKIVEKTKELQNAFGDFPTASMKTQRAVADFISASDTLKYHYPLIRIEIHTKQTWSQKLKPFFNWLLKRENHD